MNLIIIYLGKSFFLKKKVFFFKTKFIKEKIFFSLENFFSCLYIFNFNLKSNKIYPLNLSILISGGKETN